MHSQRTPSRGKNKNLLPHRYLLGGPEEGGVATQHVQSPWSPTHGEKKNWLPHLLPSRVPKRGRTCYATLAFSPIPETKRKEKIRITCLTLPLGGAKAGRNCYATPALVGVLGAKDAKNIRTGCLTLAFSVAQKRVEFLPHPCILGGPQRQARG